MLEQARVNIQKTLPNLYDYEAWERGRNVFDIKTIFLIYVFESLFCCAKF